MTILITGAAGLIGRRTVELLAPAHDVSVVVRSPGNAPNVRTLAIDLSAPGFRHALPASADVVVHLAQSVHYRDFPAQAADIFNVNVGATAQLLEWATGAGVQHFVLASSGGVERSSPGVPSYYLATKRSAELLAAAYGHRFSLTVLRFYFAYGAAQRRSMLIPRLVDNVRNGRPIALAGPDGIRLNPVHVDDAAAAVARAATAAVPGTFDIAGPEVLSLRDISTIIGRKLGRAPVFDADLSAAPADLIGDTRAMAQHLVAPSRLFESGIDELLDAGGGEG